MSTSEDRCSTCLEQPPEYLVVWPDEEEWRCDACFVTDLCCIALRAKAIYHLPDCAQVKLTIRDMFGNVIE